MSRSDGVSVPDQAAAFRSMYEDSLPMVYGFLTLRVGGNQALAEDLAADTFSSAVAEYRNGRADVVTSSWLRTVAKRRLIDHWRRESVAAAKLVTLGGSTVNEMAETEMGLADRDLVIQALAELGEAERAALLLQHLDGHSVAEVADLIGRTIKATESLLSRARRAFRAAYLEVENV